MFNEKTRYKTMLRIIKKKFFIVVLSGIVNAPNHAKCVLLSNQK